MYFTFVSLNPNLKCSNLKKSSHPKFNSLAVINWLNKQLNERQISSSKSVPPASMGSQNNYTNSNIDHNSITAFKQVRSLPQVSYCIIIFIKTCLGSSEQHFIICDKNIYIVYKIKTNFSNFMPHEPLFKKLLTSQTTVPRLDLRPKPSICLNKTSHPALEPVLTSFRPPGSKLAVPVRIQRR